MPAKSDRSRSRALQTTDPRSEPRPEPVLAPQARALLQAARRARAHACAPWSKFRVGAALLTSEGRIFTGCNVESASYGLTCCAERVALFKALSEGARQFLAIAIAAPVPGGPTPCGACRQLLAEYAPGAVVWSGDSRRPGKIRQWTIRELLPQAFLRF